MSVTHFRRGNWDVYIGRHSAGARRAGIPASACIWGNPFAMRDERDDHERAEVVAKYERWLLDPKQDAMVQLSRRELKGKCLACWCSPKQCHGDVLAWVANVESIVEINRRRMELGIREVVHSGDVQ
ncbi:hypothetical protein R1flu_024028 [Riccia fluitans]|uniref:DUF4326 domain-containing protein n=1 Tax=Riccia fluitans TaxID=41844 RepID=A0ABD1XTQ7_9MARC